MSTLAIDARLRELALNVRTYSDRPGVIFGEPHTLKEICRLLGFKNDCRKGSVYLTDVKLARLGLRTSTETLLERMGRS